MKNTFLPQIKLVNNNLILNNEAIETMNLDSPDSKVIILNVKNPDSKRLSNELLIVKTNGSMLDNPADLAELITPDKIRPVIITEDESGEKAGNIAISEVFKNTISDVFKKDQEFKLVVCNTDSKVIKEFKDIFDINENYYRIVKLNDKRTVLGKDKSVEIKNEERVKL